METSENCYYEDIDISNSSFDQASERFDAIENITESTESNFLDTSYSRPNWNSKVSAQIPSFYFPNLNRNQAEGLLNGHDNGVFLIRDSFLFRDRLTLSFVNNSSFEHYIIQCMYNSVSIDFITWFKSINDLIKHYQMFKNNLPVLLTVALSSNYFNDCNIDQKFIISINDLKFNELIGSGEFAVVRKGELNNESVAIKQLKDTTSSIKNGLREAKIMSKLNHKNIIKLYGITIQSKILLITEYISNGNLSDYLQSRGKNYIKNQKLNNYCYQVCCAFEYLQTLKIVHCDLCASNVLVDVNNVVKLSDFGLAISLTNEEIDCYKSESIRVKWTAPESLGGINFSFKSDVWSFSIFMWELFSYGRLPYPCMKVEDIESFLMGGNRMNAPENCPRKIYKIMQKCWRFVPEERPTFNYLKKFFSDLI